MRCQISFITKKSKGGIIRRDTTVDNEVIRIGRSTANEIYLEDFRTTLHHATIHDRQGKFFIEAQSGSEVRVNGKSKDATPIKDGDVIAIGPYDLTIKSGTDGHELCIEVELVRPLGDDLEALKTRSVTSLSATGLSKRTWSWLLFIVIAGLFIALPLAAFFNPQIHAMFKDKPVTADIAWKTGEFDSAHQFFAKDCKACHQKAFITVRDSACIACHTETHTHADPEFYKLDTLTNTRCATCHKEHNGSNALIRRDEQLCGDCHKDLDKQVSTNLANVRDFGNDHPEFKASLFTYNSADKSFNKIRVSMKHIAEHKEQSNLKFNHKKHLSPDGVDAPGGSRVMVCADCHQPDPGGAGMASINMERDCQECHRLEFEPDSPQRQVPHGNVEFVLDALTEYYGNLALQGGYQDVTAPKVVRNRRRPGEHLTREERKVAFDWAKDKALDVGADLFEGRVCSTCHTVKRVRSDYPPRWDIAPVRVADKWFPKANFTHARHKTMLCADCHDVTKSEKSSDVLIPGIENCHQCHAGTEASSNEKLTSTCVDCHGFHIAKDFLLGNRKGVSREMGVSGTLKRVLQK